VRGPGHWPVARSAAQRPMVRRDVAQRLPRPEVEGKLDLPTHLLRPGTIGLVDDEAIRRLHYPRLEGLDPVPRLGDEDEHRRVGHPGDIELGLTDADRLDQDAVEAG